jgi:predicted nuclease of predicted toxin-antitoxin system
MTGAFYMDVHVPAAITRGLRRVGISVLTAQEDGANEFDDPKVLDRATELNRLVFSMDEDFLAEAAHRLAQGIQFSTVVFARPREITIGQCIHDLEIIARLATQEELRGHVLYLPL